MAHEQLVEKFVAESNRIEGIDRPPTREELFATREFLALSHVTHGDLENLARVYVGERGRLRREAGMDVYVGSHVPLKGGPEVPVRLEQVLRDVNESEFSPWLNHCAYEDLHPFMDGNGRTGRALWAWDTLHRGRDPFALPFLHRFYYETLAQVEL